MKKILLCLFVLASVIMLAGCKHDVPSDNGKTPDPNPVSKDITGTGMMQIHIVSTENNGKMDFVTEPVSEVVTEARKGWLVPDNPLLKLPYPWYEKCTVSVYDKEGKNLLDESSAQVKVRGNWSSSYDKKPLRIKFDEKQKMGNVHEGTEFKNWVLLAEYKDFSLLRNATALKLAKLFGSKYYSSDCEFAEVYINNKYWGVYLLAEQQEPKKGKIKLTEDAASNEIGYFIEYDGNADFEDFKFEIDYKHTLTDFNGKEVTKGKSKYSFKSDVTQEQTDFIAEYMNNLWELCYQAAYNNEFYKIDAEYNLVNADEGEFANAKECVSAVVDLESLAESYLHQEIVCDADIYLNSFFMDLDLSPKSKKKLTFEAPWDFDSGLGNKKQVADGQGVWAGAICPDVNYEHFDECNPWLMVFINCDWFKEMVSAKWAKLKEVNALGQLTKQIDDVKTDYATNFVKNNQKWPVEIDSFGNELNEGSAACTTQKAAADFLKSWLTKRFAYLDTVWGAYDPTKSLVILNYKNGTPTEKIELKTGDCFPKPEDPTKKYSEFQGWFYGEKEYDFSKPVTGTVVINAKWLDKGAETESGRCIVENDIYNGTPCLKVTLKRFEQDYPGKNLDTCRLEVLGADIKTEFYDDWHVTQLKPKVNQDAVFYMPFIEEGKDYEIKYIYQYSTGPWEEETCKVTAIDTGLSLGDYFTFDEEFEASKIICNEDSYNIKLSNDISSKVKNSVIWAVLDGYMAIGDVYWHKTSWIEGVAVGLKNADDKKPSDISYEKLLSDKGFTFTSSNFNKAAIDEANAKEGSETWFVYSDIKFKINDFTEEYRLMHDFAPEKGHEARNPKNLQ